MRRWILGTSLVVATLLVAAFEYGCGQTSFGTCVDTGTCPLDGGATDGTTIDATPAEGSTSVPDGSGGSGDGGVMPTDGQTACNFAVEPKDAACQVDDAYGVFVSGSGGQDDAVGDKDHPVKTITEGIAKAAQSSKAMVFVCNATYAEQVGLDAQHDGISLYGGFDCSSWTWVGTTTRAQVQGPSALYALRIDSTTKPIVIADMTFTVPDATGLDTQGAGNSSIAAFVSNETAGVSLRRIALQAGAGAGGADGGAPATNLYSTNASDLQGTSATGINGAPAKTCPCKVFGTTTGGAGGGAGDPGDDGGTGTSTPVAPTVAVNRNGVGGAGYNDTTLTCLPGHPGADGVTQVDGGAGAPSAGTFSAPGWEPASGASGLPGTPGQGGGGGGGAEMLGSAGGGCGGCGGAGGTAGAGGGGGIALLLLNASVDVQSSHFISGIAGSGGSGAQGENGANGGSGGSGGCLGGAGGSGAGGQGGGGGAGGVSVGILFNTASQTTLDMQTTFTLGSQGTGGNGGAGGSGGSIGSDHAPAGPTGTKGVDGVAQQSLSR
jgi:hypothetical protein